VGLLRVRPLIRECPVGTVEKHGDGRIEVQSSVTDRVECIDRHVGPEVTMAWFQEIFKIASTIALLLDTDLAHVDDCDLSLLRAGQPAHGQLWGWGKQADEP
jgi:hypothetical protein